MRKKAVLAVTAAAFLAMQAATAYADVIGITAAPGSAASISGAPGELGASAAPADPPGNGAEASGKAPAGAGASSTVSAPIAEGSDLPAVPVPPAEGAASSAAKEASEGSAAPSLPGSETDRGSAAQPSLEPMAFAAADGPGGFGTGSNAGPQGSLGGPMSSSAESWISDVPGGMHLNDAGTEISLGFKLVSPNVRSGGVYAAEGSVQLADGSWAEIPLSKAIDAPYFRVLREETDSTGTAWYVCASYASQIGNYRTPDGSFPKELWLKKEDCRETASLRLNTTNQKRINIVRTALANLGKQYSYAGNGPDAFDCSGYVSYVFGENGINVPRQSSAICAMQKQISLAELRPGDIVGRSGHVGIYIGDGIFVHSSESETGVVSERIDVYNRTSGFTNYVNAIGD